MTETTDRLEQMLASALAAVAAADDLGGLDATRITYLGKKGELTEILRGMASLAPEERPTVGQAANDTRVALEEAIAARGSTLKATALDATLTAGVLDVTLPGRRREPGHEHIISQVVDETIDIFAGLGYKVAEGPEVELDYYNFTALNTPPDHPARGLADTFYIRDRSGDVARVTGESDVLLRTHTSPVQVRVMESQEPPIYSLMPGRVYRRDVADPSHLPMFTQIEGLVIDRDITFGDLKGTLEHFVHEMFGPDRLVRLRPHFFPFTEPSAEVDVSCGLCGGSGCRFCSGEGWLEILGCGMVDPSVLTMSDIDPDVYSGFAFGMGAERIVALKYGVPDLRLFIDGDMRFLSQF